MTENVIWSRTVDGGAYDVAVVRSDAYVATLFVSEADTGRILLNREVSLSYGAAFGPDVDDVVKWMKLALAAIDADITFQENR